MLRNINCIIPPQVLDHMATSADPVVRKLATDCAKFAAAARIQRRTLSLLPRMAATPSPTGERHRLVYDMKERTFPLPGELIRGEGQGPSRDEAVNEAFDYSGKTYDFYMELFNRNSLDGRGMGIPSVVHFGQSTLNAFWDGEQMLYGDGDGRIFVRFTKSIDVVAHELTHGVIMHECNLEYQDEPGALNEHLADVFGTLVKQWTKGHSVDQADWLIGDAIMGPDTAAKSLRTFKAGPAYTNDRFLGTDPQRKHMKDKYTGTDDRGGVHINSGIPNHAFYLAATALGGNAWETLGPIWYETLKALNSRSSFQDAARLSVQIAGQGPGAQEKQRAIQGAWKAVGL